MGRSRIRQLIRNQNTKRIDERARNKSKRKTVGRYIIKYLQYTVLLFSHTIRHLNTYEI